MMGTYSFYTSYPQLMDEILRHLYISLGLLDVHIVTYHIGCHVKLRKISSICPYMIPVKIWAYIFERPSHSLRKLPHTRLHPQKVPQEQCLA